jgi:hypothetical protein
MSTYLSLCQDTRRECRVAGTGPSTVVAQVGRLGDIVAWVAQCYTEIQEAKYWNWLRSTFTVNTVANDDTYAYGDCTDSRLSATISRFSKWWLDNRGYPNVTIYLTSAGVGSESYLIPIEWDAFRDRYRRGTQTAGQPIHITMDPQNNLVLGPKPDAIYTLNGEYQMSPQTLAADADVPEMPSRFHSLIMYRAMEKYGASNNATEVFNRGGYEGTRKMISLERDQLPGVTTSGPMA